MPEPAKAPSVPWSTSKTRLDLQHHNCDLPNGRKPETSRVRVCNVEDPSVRHPEGRTGEKKEEYKSLSRVCETSTVTSATLGGYWRCHAPGVANLKQPGLAVRPGARKA